MIFQTGSIQENTMKYKFAAADMDGTLLNDSNEITPHTVKIIRQAVDKGLIFSICTGRPIQGVSGACDHLQRRYDPGFCNRKNPLPPGTCIR